MAEIKRRSLHEEHRAHTAAWVFLCYRQTEELNPLTSTYIDNYKKRGEEICLLYPSSASVLVVGCRHKVHCFQWGSSFCTSQILKHLWGLTNLFACFFLQTWPFGGTGFPLAGDFAVHLYQRVLHDLLCVFHIVASPLLIWLSCKNFMAVCKIIHYQEGILLCLAAH